jgi:intraflagellar transport protein 46
MANKPGVKFTDKPYDEQFDLESGEDFSDSGSGLSADFSSPSPATSMKMKQPAVRKQQTTLNDDDNFDETLSPTVFTSGFYDPSAFSTLEANDEMKEVFQFITKYKIEDPKFDINLMPFFPDFVPIVGEVDGFIKVPRPDGGNDLLGLTVLDEPALIESNEQKINLALKDLVKGRSGDLDITRTIDYNTEKSEIKKWIEFCANKKQVNREFTYSDKPIADLVDTCMNKYPTKDPNRIKRVKDQPRDLEGTLNQIMKEIGCTGNISKPLEACHLLFSMYVQVKAQQNKLIK